MSEPEQLPDKKVKIFGLVDFSVTRRVSITMLILIVMVFGFISLSRMPLDFLPDISFPMVTVVAQYEGVAPEEIERLMTVPLEGVIASVSRVKKISSKSIEGYSNIMVEFEWGTNLDYAAQDIKDNIDYIRQFLPEGMKEPMVFKFSTAMFPILMVGVTGMDDPYKLKKMLEDNVQERLQRLDGVAQVQVYGGKQREITVACDPVRLRAKGQNIENINNVLFTQNLNTPAGYLTKSNTDYLLRAMGEFNSVEDIRNIIVGVAPDNRTPVRLYEVADVRDGFKEKRSVIRMNGEEAAFLIIYKQSGGNTLNVVRKIRKEIEEIKKIYPQLEFLSVFDLGKPVERTTTATTRDLLVGYVLVIFLLLIFLGNLRPTLIIAIAVPLSVITTFIVLYTTGFTLNLMTLGGLALGVGRLVDDAVVVIENIYRHLEKGDPPDVAARTGASEVSMAISASTFTTIIVFLPLLFSQGMAQQLTRGFSLTIAFSLLASLFVAFTIVPMLSSVFFRKPKKEGARWFESVRIWYGGSLAKVLRHPVLTVVAVAVVLIGSIAAGGAFVGKEFFPKDDSGMIMLTMEMPVGTTIEETSSMCAQVEKLLMSYPEAMYVGEVVGVDETQQGDPNSTITGTNGAQMFVRLKDAEHRTRSQQEIESLIRSRLPKLRNAKINIATMSGFSMNSGKPIKINIYGNNFSTLSDISNNIINAVRTVPGLHDVESSFSKARPEYHFVIDREKALLFGLTPFQVQKAIQAANLGTVMSRLRTGDEEIDIRVILDQKFRSNLEYLRQLPIRTPAGAAITLGQVADIVPGEGPLVIDRNNKYRTGIVDANFSGRPLGSVVKDIQERIKPIEKALPSGYSLSFGGEFKDMQETFTQLVLALLVAILLIYMVMAAQFESLVHPFVIMFTIPLAAIGVVWALLLFGKTLSVASFLGVIILTGIVVSNGIVMVDYVNQLRRRGMGTRDALIEGGKTRLRPVIITAGATIMGMIPLAIDRSESAALSSPMAIAVIGGLMSATFLTLFVVPVVYQAFDRFGESIKRRVKRVID